MDEVISKLELLTNQFVQSLDTNDVDAIVHFVEQRQVLIDEFTKMREQASLYASEDEAVQKAVNQKMAERIKHLLSYDPLINEKMSQMMGNTAQQVSKINQSRKREQAYNPAYSADSIYFDKKK
jgi:hypothetical protein